MNFLQAAILGIVEGLTEFLPVSSTGHLILASYLLNIPESAQLKAFEVIIQSGAMLAVVWHYRSDLFTLSANFLRRKNPDFTRALQILLAFLPAAILGLLLRKLIKTHLFGPLPVVLALLVGGVAMIVIERSLKKSSAQTSQDASSALTFKKSFIIGLFQCLAMWPGMSRSMTTILGARLVGLSAFDAATFSFYLALPTLFGATMVDVIKSRDELMAVSSDFYIAILIGGIASFLVALVVIRAFLKFLTRYSLEGFGWYRIAAGILFYLCLFA